MDYGFDKFGKGEVKEIFSGSSKGISVHTLFVLYIQGCVYQDKTAPNQTYEFSYSNFIHLTMKSLVLCK